VGPFKSQRHTHVCVACTKIRPGVHATDKLDESWTPKSLDGVPAPLYIGLLVLKRLCGERPNNTPVTEAFAAL